jgi:hypothetical protein
MGKPQNNGLVELIDEKQDMDNSSWNCMDFHLFSFHEEDKSWEASHARFLAAKSGNCPYKSICPRYARTMAKRGKQPVQLKLF